MSERLSELISNYRAACTLIVESFCEKQEMRFEHWVDIGYIALCSDFYLSLSDIIYDLETEQPKGRIIDWYDEQMERENIKDVVAYKTWLFLFP